MIHSYSTVYQIGHKAIQNLFEGDVIIEEKVDGSQFSFGLLDGELQVRSHGKQMLLDAPEKMFNKIVDYVKYIKDLLHPGWTYRGEYLEKPKHNVLAYDRTPVNNFIGFDIMCENPEEYICYLSKEQEFERIGFETVPLIYSGKIDNVNMFVEFLDRVSILGGSTVEGVVVKNYSQFSLDKKICMGKYVSEKFKEIANKDWKERNPTGKDIILVLGQKLKTEARWQKAVIHLKESGNYDGSPKDIGNLIKEVKDDIQKECQDEIKDSLYKWAIDNILRQCVAGVPEWYKEQLLKEAFVDN
jgi:hypothetical protein